MDEQPLRGAITVGVRRGNRIVSLLEYLRLARVELAFDPLDDLVPNVC